MIESKAQTPIVINKGDKIELPPKRKCLLNYFAYHESREKVDISVNFERRSAFLRIIADSFGELNPKELKKAVCKAIDKYYELK